MEKGVYRFASIYEYNNNLIKIKYDNTSKLYNSDLSISNKFIKQNEKKHKLLDVVNDEIVEQLVKQNLRYGFFVNNNSNYYFYKLIVDYDDFCFEQIQLA